MAQMAENQRNPDDSLIGSLLKEPERFELLARSDEALSVISLTNNGQAAVVISLDGSAAPVYQGTVARIAGRNPGGGITLPAVPCIGSTMIAATAPPVWFRMTFRVSSAQARPQSGYVRCSGHR